MCISASGRAIVTALAALLLQQSAATRVTCMPQSLPEEPAIVSIDSTSAIDSIPAEGNGDERERNMREGMFGQQARYLFPTILVGVSSGINFAVHSGMMVPEVIEDGVSPIGTTISMKPLIGIHAVWYLDTDRRDQAIMARITYNDQSGPIIRPARDRSYINWLGVPSTMRMLHYIDLEYKLISADLLWTDRVQKSNLLLLTGPSFGMVLSARRRDAYLPATGWASTYISPWEMQPLRLGIKVGAQYEFKASRSLWLAPIILYDLALTRVQKEEPWRADALQIGIDIRLPLKGGTGNYR